MRRIELARSSAFLPPFHEVYTILIVFDDPIVRVFGAVPIGDKDVPIRSDRHGGWRIESVVIRALDSLFAKRHQYFSVGAELENHIALAVLRADIGDPDVSLLIDGKA